MEIVSGKKISIKLLIILWAVFAIFPWISHNSYITSLGIIFFINLMLIASLNLVMGYCGQISLCHGGFYGLGAYVSGALSAKLGVSAVFGVICAIVITGIAALIIALPALRLRGHYLAMATLGFGVILSVFFVELVGITGGPNGLSGISPIRIFSYTFESDISYFYLVWGIAIFMMWAILNLIHSRIGRAIASVSNSEIGAASLGVDAYVLKVKVFVFSASIAALAGALYAHYNQFASPEMFTFFTSVLLVMMVALGGWGSFWGPLYGALIFTIVPELLRSLHDLELLIFGVGMVLVLMFYPGGIAAMVANARKPLSRIKVRAPKARSQELKNG